MNYTKLAGVIIASFALLMSATAVAQDGDGDNALSAGQSALSFTAPFGGNPYVPGALGYHYMMADNMRLGINLDASLSNRDVGGDETETDWDVGIAPQLNYYTNPESTVSPFFFGLANFGRSDVGGDGDTRLNLAGGFGAEWFPVTRFSISGQVGLNLRLLGEEDRTTITTINIGDDNDLDFGDEDENFGFELFTSSLAATIYF